jgi:hypothetical protein
MDGYQRDPLKIRSVIACRLDTGQRELRGKILGGQFCAARAGTAALQQVERKKADMRADLFRIDGRSRGARRLGQAGNRRNSRIVDLLATEQGSGQDGGGEDD